MPNPNPKQTAEFKAQQLPKIGDRALSKKVIGVRFTQEVFKVLEQMPSDERQALIRAAVEEKLKADGLMEG